MVAAAQCLDETAVFVMFRNIQQEQNVNGDKIHLKVVVICCSTKSDIFCLLLIFLVSMNLDMLWKQLISLTLFISFVV